jgi:hypothetical protein
LEAIGLIKEQFYGGQVTLLNIKDEFLKRAVDWQEKLNEDVWFFVRLYEDLTSYLTHEESFILIPQVVNLTLEQTDESNFLGSDQNLAVFLYCQL